MEWLPFILALAFGREHAVVVASASSLSSTETLFLTAAWYLALGCLVVCFLDHPRIARKLAKLQDVSLFRWLLGSIPRALHGIVVFAVCFAPGGFWWGILLMTLWKYRWYQRVLLVAVGNTVSYFAYEWAMTPFLALFGAYVLLAIPALLLAGLVVKKRGRLIAAGNWSLQRYRLIFSKATS